MRALVTGGRGVVGRRLVDRLQADGHEVTVWDVVDGFDVRHIMPTDLRDVDTVFHLAANADISVGFDRPDVDFNHTVVGTFCLLQAMKGAGCKRLVFTSSSGVYGDTGENVVGERDFTLRSPVNAYAAAKASAEAWIAAYSALYGISALVYRPANITGPGATHGVTHDFVKKLQREPAMLRVLGNGEQVRAYLHVDDAVDALLLPISGTYNLTNDSYLSARNIAHMVARKMGLKPAITFGSGRVGWKGDVSHVAVSSFQLTQAGFRPQFNATDAVLATVEWMMAQAQEAA